MSTDGRHPDDDDVADAIKVLDRMHQRDLDRFGRIDEDDPPPEVRLAVCRDRGHHLYAPSTDVNEFTTNLQQEYVRRVPCTSCRIAVRVEHWDLKFDGAGKVIAAKLLTQYPGSGQP